jgi:small GTP-binding protein
VSAPLDLLDEAQRALLAEERALLGDLRAAVPRLGASPADQDALAQSVRQLDELFLVVVVGEFNAGKSAFLNALVGADALEEGVTPTTARITLVRHGDAPATRVTESGLAEVVVPAPVLRDLHLVDTPGTNAVLREHEAVTTEFVPRADLVLFLTSADRPFTESERAFLARIRDWGKKIVFVVNKADILDGPAQVAQVLDFVGDGARRLLGIEPVLFAVSARAARRGREGEAAAWAASGFEAFQAYLQRTLDEGERVRLKLRNPLGVARRVVGDLRREVDARLELIHEDGVVVDEVERHVGQYEADMHREFSLRWSDIEKVLVEMERRGHDHFDDTIRLGRVVDLLNRARVREMFERSVVADTPQRIEHKVHELIDWMVEADYRQWQAVNDRLAERRAAHRERMGAAAVPASGFLADRTRLLESVGREAQRVVETYDRAGEATSMADKARTAVAASAAIEVGAAGLGAVVAAVATSAAADITGLAMAGVLATVGLLLIPNRRRQAKHELREKVTDMRERLGISLRGAFDDELARGIGRLRAGVNPYARFVRAERDHLTASRAELDGFDGRLTAISARVDALGSNQSPATPPSVRRSPSA